MNSVKANLMWARDMFVNNPDRWGEGSRTSQMESEKLCALGWVNVARGTNYNTYGSPESNALDLAVNELFPSRNDYKHAIFIVNDTAYQNTRRYTKCLYCDRQHTFEDVIACFDLAIANQDKKEESIDGAINTTRLHQEPLHSSV